MNSLRSCSTPLRVSRPSPPLICRLQTASAWRDLSTNSAVSAATSASSDAAGTLRSASPIAAASRAAEQPARVDQLARALHADRPRQADRAAAAGITRPVVVWPSPDLRVVGGDDQVAGQRELEARRPSRSR